MATVFIITICSFINNFIISHRIPNFLYHGNKGLSEENFKDTVKLANPENLPLGAKFSTISPM